MTQTPHNNVAGRGTKITLADGEHRVFVDTLGLIEIEDDFDGFMSLLSAFATKPVKTIVAVLEHCEIDGDVWDREQIANQMRGVAKMSLAADMQMYLLEEMGYTEEKIDIKKATKKLADMGVDISKVDPTKPETWMPNNLSSLAPETTPAARKQTKKKTGSISTR